MILVIHAAQTLIVLLKDIPVVQKISLAVARTQIQSVVRMGFTVVKKAKNAVAMGLALIQRKNSAAVKEVLASLVMFARTLTILRMLVIISVAQTGTYAAKGNALQ